MIDMVHVCFLFHQRGVVCWVVTQEGRTRCNLTVHCWVNMTAHRSSQKKKTKKTAQIHQVQYKPPLEKSDGTTRMLMIASHWGCGC